MRLDCIDLDIDIISYGFILMIILKIDLSMKNREKTNDAGHKLNGRVSE